MNLQPHTVFVSEPGLYLLILKSKLPIAEKFQDWVFEEVLPSIRKHGEYKLITETQALRSEIIQLSQLFVNAIENNKQLALVNCQLEASKSELEASKSELETTNQTLSKTLALQAPRVAVLPEDDDLKHVFCVLIKETLLEMYGVCEYKCIRTEKRNFNKALKKAKEEGFEMCFFRENVPNGVNILNKAKEVMCKYGMHYDSAYNNVLTSYNFVNIIEHVLDHE